MMTILHEIYGNKLQRYSSPLSNFFRSGISFQNGRLSNRKSDDFGFFNRLSKPRISKMPRKSKKKDTVTECSIIYED